MTSEKELVIEWKGVDVPVEVAVENGYDGEVRQVRTNYAGQKYTLPRGCTEGCKGHNNHDFTCPQFSDTSHADGYGY